MFETAREELAERIKVLRRKAEERRRDATISDQDAYAAREVAEHCDRLADEYEALLGD